MSKELLLQYQQAKDKLESKLSPEDLKHFNESRLIDMAEVVFDKKPRSMSNVLSDIEKMIKAEFSDTEAIQVNIQLMINQLKLCSQALKYGNYGDAYINLNQDINYFKNDK